MSIIATITRYPIHVDSDDLFYSSSERISFHEATEEEKKEFILDRLDLIDADYEITLY